MMKHLRCPARWALLGFAVAIAQPAHAGPPALPGYADYTAFQSQMKALARPGLAELKSLGTTLQGREVYVLRVGTGNADTKPALLVVGSVHAPHLLGSELTVRMARRLVDASVKDKTIGKLLDRTTFYFIPRPSPDASEAFFQPPYFERTGNARITRRPDQVEDLGRPADLNGDGQITMLRVEDAHGTYVADAKDPRAMVAAEGARDARPRYKLNVEGRGSDADGPFRVGPADGVDFNRNFPFRYAPFQPGSGPNAVSEIETRAVADFAFAHRNIVAVLGFTPEDNLLHPWKPDPAAEQRPVKTTLLQADAPYIEHVTQLYRKLLGRQDSPESVSTPGSFSQWAYYQYGRWSFACRGWWVPGEPPSKPAAKPQPNAAKPPEGKNSDEVNALRWFDREKIDAFSPWKPIAHPDLPGRKVEVGGFKPFVRLNPPARELESLADKHWAFARQLAELFPRLRIAEARVQSLASGVWQITTTVVNDGYLPTVAKMGDVSEEHQLLQIQVELPKGTRLVTGVARRALPVLSGNGGRAEQTWLIQSSAKTLPPLKFRVWCPSAGEDVRTVGEEGVRGKG